MSILRPQQAASECEGLAAHMASLKRVSAGEIYKFFHAQQKTYERRRDHLIKKYGIQASSLPRPERSHTEKTGK